MPLEEPVCAVAVDDAAPSATAAGWACWNAVAERGELRLVTVEPRPLPDESPPDWLVELAARCRRHHPGLRVTTEVLAGRPAERLLEVAQRCSVLVLGSHGHGALHDAVLGSVALGVAERAACPVLVVRGRTDPEVRGPVVVGADESANGRHAVGFAFRAAEALRCELLAVQALPDAAFLPGPYAHPDRDELVAGAQRELAEVLSGFGPEHPDVPVRRLTSAQDPITALVTAAEGARLLVVGRSGTGGLGAMIMGSVSRGVLRHAPCPVAVVPGG